MTPLEAGRLPRPDVVAAGWGAIGLSTGVLHDLDGPVGVCAQALFVDRR